MKHNEWTPFLQEEFRQPYFVKLAAFVHGVTVLGIGDSPYYDVHPRLKEALKEYYFVQDLSDKKAMSI